MIRPYAPPEPSYSITKGDGFLYLLLNPEKFKKSAEVKTLDSQGSVYQHHIENITKSIQKTIQKSSSPIVLNPVNTRSLSGLFGFILACVCSVAVEGCFVIIRTAYRMCNHTHIYPSSFFGRHTVDVARITGLKKFGLFHIVSSPNGQLK